MKRVFGALFVLLFYFQLPASVADLEQLFEQEDFKSLEQMLPSHAAASPNDPIIIFFQGFTNSNPDAAVVYYERVVNEFPASKYADYAMFRLGQYYYFEGDYPTARRYYSKLFRIYPNSELKDDAQYLYCQCVLAEGKVDSAKMFLKAFVQNAKRSPYVDAAILDVEELGGLPQRDLTKPVENIKSSTYSIQVASYKNLSDAQNAVHKLSRVFPNVQIGERELGNATYYHVLIGKFNSKTKAEDYARLYIRPHLNQYDVIETSR